MDALTLHRIHFAFTITYHYLFPQLTMGLALLIVVLKTLALKSGDERAATRLAHDMRAVSGSLGMKPLEQSALKLEAAFNTGALPTRLN